MFRVFIAFLFISLAQAQWKIQTYHEEGISIRANFTSCLLYCELKNAECIYQNNWVTAADGILLYRYTPGLCQCYDGFGGNNCTADVSTLQNTTGKHISYDCKYPVLQSWRLPNGSLELYTQCTCALGYSGKNCDKLCQRECGQGYDVPRGFCHTQLNNNPICYCYGDWTGFNCQIYLPEWIRSVKDAIGYITLPILFIFLLMVSVVILILVCIPKKGKKWSDHNKISLGLKFASALFVFMSLLTKLIGSITEWSWDYANGATFYLILLDIVLNLCAFISMITLWSQLKDVAIGDKRGVSIKFTLGILMICFQFLLFGCFTIAYAILFGIRKLDSYQWLYLVFNIVAFIEFFAVGVGFLVFGIAAFVDLKRVDRELKFESLKFTQFMTAICIVFASQGLWQLVLAIDNACLCLGGTGFFVFVVIQMHEFVYLSLMMYLLLPDKAQLKRIFCSCLNKSDS